VQQGGEPHLLVLLRCLTYTVQPAWPAVPALHPERVRLCRVLLGQRHSLRDLLRPSRACVRPLRWYYAAVRLPVAVRVGLIAHRLLPPFRPLPAAESPRASRFSRAQRTPSFYACVGSTTPQVRIVLALFAHAAVLPSGWPDTVGAHGFGDFGAHQLQGYPAHICPSPTLPVRRYRRPHMARGQDGSLLLSCMTLAFTTSRRFIPTLSGPGACPTKSVSTGARRANLDRIEVPEILIWNSSPAAFWS
jgi:hypothetical protein